MFTRVCIRPIGVVSARLASVASALVIVLISLAATAEPFSLTGRYEGLYACDSTRAGVPSGWGRPVQVAIVQKGSVIAMDLTYDDDVEGGSEFSLYRGEVSPSPAGDTITGYFEGCGGTFSARELVRMFPASTVGKDFQFAADGIWTSSETPNLPGLIVQSCKWSLRRISTQKPAIRPCATEFGQ